MLKRFLVSFLYNSENLSRWESIEIKDFEFLKVIWVIFCLDMREWNNY